MKTFSYGYSVEVTLPFDEVIKKTRDAFQKEGFGALTEIDVQAKMKEKIGKEMER